MSAVTSLCLNCVVFIWIICCKGQDLHEDESKCPTEREKDKCCSGYRKINGSCTACIGFTGENCENFCPGSTYGPLCRKKCNCTHDEICNRYVGCIKNCSKPIHNEKSPFPRRKERSNTLLYLVLGLGGSLFIFLILCVIALCAKCCRLPQQRAKSSNDSIDVSESHAGKEMNQISSRYRGISSLNDESTNGDHYNTVKHNDILDSSSTVYDSSASADRLKKHANHNWNTKIQCDVPDFPSSNLHDVLNKTPVNLHATQPPLRPYSLLK